MQEGGSAPGPGRAVPTLAPTGQVYYGGVRGMGGGVVLCLLPGVGEAKLPWALVTNFLVLLPCYLLNAALRAGTGMGVGVLMGKGRSSSDF